MKESVNLVKVKESSSYGKSMDKWCNVCNEQIAKYRCASKGCSKRYCSVSCHRKHKAEAKCSRDVSQNEVDDQVNGKATLQESRNLQVDINETPTYDGLMEQVTRMLRGNDDLHHRLNYIYQLLEKEDNSKLTDTNVSQSQRGTMNEIGIEVKQVNSIQAPLNSLNVATDSPARDEALSLLRRWRDGKVSLDESTRCNLSTEKTSKDLRDLLCISQTYWDKIHNQPNHEKSHDNAMHKTSS